VNVAGENTGSREIKIVQNCRFLIINRCHMLSTIYIFFFSNAATDIQQNSLIHYTN